MRETVPVPAEILFHPTLNPYAKLLYALLVHSEENRRAQNHTLAKLLGLKSIQAMSNAITKLRKLGFIRVEFFIGGEWVELGPEINHKGQWSPMRRIILK